MPVSAFPAPPPEPPGFPLAPPLFTPAPPPIAIYVPKEEFCPFSAKVFSFICVPPTPPLPILISYDPDTIMFSNNIKPPAPPPPPEFIPPPPPPPTINTSHNASFSNAY